MDHGEQAHEASSTPEERYRLYIDESGDHVLRQLDDPAHRYLCLLGCWFQDSDYRAFHRALEDFKQRHIPHNPDDPVILHREDIVNRRGPYWRLRDPVPGAAFDNDMLRLIAGTDFRIVAVVIDKLGLQVNYQTPAHPYHLAAGFMLQRYCGYLNHISRRGDVMAESRGGREDKLLKGAYEYVYNRGDWMRHGEFFRRALTTGQLKLKTKSANVAGLQLADLLGHPIRQSVLLEKGRVSTPLGQFAREVVSRIELKFNRHLYDGRIWGYGKVFFPGEDK